MVRREEDGIFEQQQYQEPSRWHKRAERGRKRLSASVEDVLAERASGEPLLEPEEEEAGEELVSAPQADARPAGLVPPRLSLQSRELAVPSSGDQATPEQELSRPGSSPESPSRSLAAAGSQSGPSETAEEAEKLAANRVLAAFARRVTASLAALGKVRQPGQRLPAPITTVLPALPAGGEGDAASSPSPTVTAGSAPAASAPEPGPTRAGERPGAPSAQMVAPPPAERGPESGSRAAAGPASAAASPQPRETPARPSSQRLAGRTTRVRLEAAPKLASPPAVPGPAGLTQATPPQTTRPLPALTGAYPSYPANPARPGAPASARPGERPLPTTALARPVPAGRAEQPAPAALTAPMTGPRWQTGKSCFTRGQGEVAVNCPVVSEASVVLVTLTGDPGPVVVQYVSLQPGRGFTVHLSAPAQRETPFHYAVLESAPLNSGGESTLPGNS